MKRYKILIICGGGVFGAIPAHFLGMLPNSKQTLAGVDLIAGCSIGGILAAAYAIGKPFYLIDEVFQQRAGECFCKRFNARINPLACPTYKTETLDAVLDDMIGQAKLGDIQKYYPRLKIVVPALNITEWKYLVFENITRKYLDVPLKDVAGFTSAAPSYYAGREFEGNCIIDGGLIEVAPLLTATHEVKHKYGIPFMAMDVLMLGTGRDEIENPLTLKKYNALDIIGIAKKVLRPQATLGNEMATTFWGEQMGLGMFNYFNPCVIDGALDDVSQIPDLIKNAEQYKDDFFRAWDEWLSR
ncbi:MAG: patatin-like phospholipase family protein [Lentisphaeria bacterium]|nr:patatin-like phospholipase family protein [Lentisphaeria bacterium]